MTKEEAIKYATGMLKEGGNIKRQQFVWMATIALDKQIPKHTIATDKFVSGACPYCKALIDTNNEQLPYCPYCGQAIDWGNE